MHKSQNILWETPRLRLTAPQESDLEFCCALQADPEVMKYMGKNHPSTRPEINQLLKKYVTHQEEHGFSFGNVYRKEDHAFLGRAGMIYLDFKKEHQKIEVGYMLARPYWSLGYATEIVTCLVDYSFSYLEVFRLYAVPDPKNLASRRVLEKCGFKSNGIYNFEGNEAVLYEKSRKG